MQTVNYDIIVVGSGPAGLTAAIYALRAGKRVLVLEKSAFGGQITHSPKIENYPGYTQISGNELADQMVEQALNLGADVNLEEVTALRPYAIMINNLVKAVPQCGISKADMIYEIIAEGSVTRFMAIFHDLSDVDVIGPVRSVRPYFFRVAQHYGAVLSSAGGSDEAIDLIKKEGYDYLNGIAGAGSAFYRDE